MVFPFSKNVEVYHLMNILKNIVCNHSYCIFKFPCFCLDKTIFSKNMRGSRKFGQRGSNSDKFFEGCEAPKTTKSVQLLACQRNAIFAVGPIMAHIKC